MAFTARQNVFDPIPLVVAQCISSHRSAPPRADHSRVRLLLIRESLAYPKHQTFCVRFHSVLNRQFVEAVLFRFRAGVPWRDLPERFGDWKIVYQRFNRWAKSGVFERVFKLLATDHDNEYMMIDATIVRAHQHSAGAKKTKVRKPSADPAAD